MTGSPNAAASPGGMAGPDESEGDALSVQPQKDKSAFCVEMLVSGYPEAFAEFFETVNGMSVEDKSDEDEELAETSGKGNDLFSTEVLSILQQNFVSIEVARRADNLEQVFRSYSKIAMYFLGIGYPQHSITFFHRCVEVAEEDENEGGLMHCHFQLGVCYTQLDDMPKAIDHHEKHLQLSIKMDNVSEEEKGYDHIIAVYKKRVKDLKQVQDWEGAIEVLNKCIAQAQNSANVVAEGEADYELGNCYIKLGDLDMALEYYTAYHDICVTCEDKVGEGKACCALAATYQDIGDIDSAMGHLESFLELSKSGDTTSQAQACCSLGIIHFEQKKYDRAVSYFEKFFESARSLNNSKLLDAARLNLGIARGRAKMESYFDTVNADFGRLLQWKNTRMPLPE